MYYFVYLKAPGEKRYLLSNPRTGEIGLGMVFAPRFTEKQLDTLKAWCDDMNQNSDFQVQIRKTDGKTIVYPKRRSQRT